MKIKNKHLDMYNDKRLSSAKQYSDSELSDLWYREKAIKFLQDYGGNLEDAWEEITAKRFVSSLKATSNIEIDEKKMLKAILDLLDERSDRVLQRTHLKETAEWLNKIDDNNYGSNFYEVENDVSKLINARQSHTDYINLANKIYSIRHANVPSHISESRYGLSRDLTTTVPAAGRLPHATSMRSLDEKALDLYCEAWNSKQSLKDEPMQLSWSVHPSDSSKISFKVTLK